MTYFQPLTNSVGFPSLVLPEGVAVEQEFRARSISVLRFEWHKARGCTRQHWPTLEVNRRCEAVIWIMRVCAFTGASTVKIYLALRILLLECLVSGFCRKTETKTPYFFGLMVVASCPSTLHSDLFGLVSTWSLRALFQSNIFLDASIFSRNLKTLTGWWGFVHRERTVSFWQRPIWWFWCSCHFLSTSSSAVKLWKVADRSKCSVFCPDYRSLVCRFLFRVQTQRASMCYMGLLQIALFFWP